MAWPTTSKQSRGYGGPWERTIRPRILARDDYLCVPCRKAGRIRPATEVDHIVPLAQAGTEEDDNLQSICRRCHEAKTAAEMGRTVRRATGADGWPVE